MSDGHRRFIEQIVTLIRVRLDLATDEAVTHGYDRFYEGRAFTLAEVIQTMQELAPGFDLDKDALGLPEPDAVVDFYTTLMLNRR